ERQPGPDPVHGLRSQVDSGPVGALAYYTLRLRSLTQSDLEHSLPSYVQIIDARGQMGLVLVAESVVIGEEPVVIAVESLPKPTDLGVSTDVAPPEALDRLLVHQMCAVSYLIASAVIGSGYCLPPDRMVPPAPLPSPPR